MRRNLALLAATSAALGALLLVSCASGGDGLDDAPSQRPLVGGSPEEQLANRYAPILYLRRQSERCDRRGEAFDPVDVEIVLGSPSVRLREDAAGRPTVVSGPSGSDLFRRGPEYFLDLPGNPIDPGCRYEQDYRALRDDYSKIAYARIVREEGYDELVLQYWFFYYFNDWNNRHEGDWERIHLVFDASTVEEALEQDPVRVAYAQHSGGERADWDDDKLDKESGRPVVYVATGSHASQFGPHVYIGKGEGGTGFGCDDASGPSRRLALEARLLPDGVTDPGDPFAWLTYGGRWGQLARGKFHGPRGPNTNMAWDRPLTWEEEKTREGSVRIPSRDTVGRSALQAFCTVVAFGSETLLAFYDQRPYIAIVLVFGVSLGVPLTASRTRFRPVLAFPLRQERALGQIMAVSAELYRRNFALFIGIGAVFVPLGFVESGFQSLVLGNPPVETIVGLLDRTVAPQAFIALLIGGLGTLGAYGLAVSAMAVALREIDADRSVGPFAAYRMVFDRFRTLAGARLLALAKETLLTLTVVGIPAAIERVIRWLFIEHAVLLEDARTGDAADASASVVQGAWWRTFGAAVLLGTLGLSTGPIVGVALLLFSPASLSVINVASSLVYVAVLPYVGCAFTLLYFDLRARLLLKAGSR